MTRQSSIGAALPLVLVIACGGGGTPAHGGSDIDAMTPDAPAGPAAPDAGGEDGMPGGYSLPSFPGGNSFFYLLPPSFSRFLPLYGEGSTREPPGFYDTTSDDFFSYAFIWWIDGTADLSTSALRDDIQIYYTGLCPSPNVAATLDDPSAATRDAGALVARRAGTLNVGMCFSNPVPLATIEVSSYECPDHHAVLVLVSPQPTTSQVWSDLYAIRDG